MENDFSITVLTGTYHSTPERDAELVEALVHNLENPLVDQVHLFVEDPVEQYLEKLEAATEGASLRLRELVAHPKLQRVPHGSRPTYEEYFAYSDAALAGRLVALLNSDIYLDDSVKLLEKIDWTDTFACVSRDKTGLRHAGNDAWIFIPPLKPFKKFRCDYPLGVGGGDRRMAYMAQESAGYFTINPGRSLYLHHCHASELRTWRDRPCIGSHHAIIGPQYIDEIVERQRSQ